MDEPPPKKPTKYQIPTTFNQQEYSRALYLCQKFYTSYPYLSDDQKAAKPRGEVVIPKPVISFKFIGLYHGLFVMTGAQMTPNIIKTKCHACHSDMKFPNLGPGKYQTSCIQCGKKQLVKVA